MIKHLGKIIDRIENVDIIDCRSCGFLHVLPIPTDDELKIFYEKEFYQNEKPNYFKETKEDLSWWMATYNNYYALLEQHTKGRKILDVGSGPGHFLACGKKRGWNVIGIEPSARAARYSNRHGLKTVNDFFGHDKAKNLGKFDVLHAAMVLEHVPNPRDFIIDMKKMIKKGGLIAIFCPNDYNPLQGVLRSQYSFDPWWVVPKHHLNYFTVKSMEKLLHRLGFKIEETLGTYPIETFLISGKNYVGNHAIGRACHGKRKNFELLLYKKDHDILNDLYTGLAALGIGREFMIIARNI